MKLLITLLNFFLVLSCYNSEKVRNKIATISIEEATLQDTIKLASQKDYFDLSPNEEEEIVFDTIPILDHLHFACLEFHDIDDIIISLVRRDKDSFTVLIPKFRSRGGFYDTILVQDYNFDGLTDLDFILRPGCRSGANAIHHIYLNQGNKFAKAVIPQYSFLSPVLKEKTVYGIYNGVDDFELIKATWKGDSLLIKELIDIQILEGTDNYTYKATFYTVEEDKKVRIKEEIINDLPKNYTEVLWQNILI